jgi:uncharacterized protein (UPF0333 family)
MSPVTPRAPRKSSRSRGQASTEYIVLSFGMLVIAGGGLMTFAPDSVAALTIYIRGFYLVLGLPLG